jgi:hypothetical protein
MNIIVSLEISPLKRGRFSEKLERIYVERLINLSAKLNISSTNSIHLVRKLPPLSVASNTYRLRVYIAAQIDGRAASSAWTPSRRQRGRYAARIPLRGSSSIG